MNEYTPMMRQYLEVKKELPDTIVFYRLGDFYEMFFEDAKLASQELDLVLTGRDAGVSERVPMCGIPYHAAAGYIQRLIAKGYKVAIVEQMEAANAGKGIVKREVVRIITPGTYVDDNDDRSCNYLACLAQDAFQTAVVLVDNASGETLYAMLPKDVQELEQFLCAQSVREIVVAPSFDASTYRQLEARQSFRISYEAKEDALFEYAYLTYGINEPLVFTAYQRMLHYLQNTFKQSLAHLTPVQLMNGHSEMKMDYYTLRNLELTSTIRQNSKANTLWQFLDRCKSAMGSRMLRKWIEHPLYEQKQIEQRLDAVAFLSKEFLVRDSMQTHLAEVYDLERLTARIANQNTNGADLIRLKQTLVQAPMILAEMAQCPAYVQFHEISVCAPLQTAISHAIAEDAPISVKDGGIFVDGYHEELDMLRNLKHNGRRFIAALEAKEKERSGIKTLKIGYNRVFGYYIEVSKGAVSLVSDELGYIRKQTLTNCERYITQELKEKEEAILHAEERLAGLELALFQEFVISIQPYLQELQALAAALAQCDVLQSFAQISNDYGYVRPVFHASGLHIQEARHPILEQRLKSHAFVANDCHFDEATAVLLITGPNMGGKSTYMRTVAVTIIMAQIGCFVSAASCEMALFDQIFTRIGANDDLMSGQSTFMVEMMEANHALQHATARSLILFDEIGRGTSTYDGLALAQSMVEYICQNIHAKTLFSTHYHELTALGDANAAIQNVHVLVKEENDQVHFLYKVQIGKADRSYGIHVAKLANLPPSILHRASELLHDLEMKQPLLFEQYIPPIMEKENPIHKKLLHFIADMDPSAISPRGASDILYQLKDWIEEK